MSNNESNRQSSSAVVLVLFHNDLRVQDNAALIKAVQLAQQNCSTKSETAKDDSTDGRLILVYAPSLATDIRQTKWHNAYQFDAMGAARQRFLDESLADLDHSVQQLGNRLLYLQSSDEDSNKDSAAQLFELIEQNKVTDICASYTADYAQNQAYKALQDKYASINWHYQATATLFADMPTTELPKSFTQFRKKVEATHNLLAAKDDLTVCSAPDQLPALPERLLNSDEYMFNAQIFAEDSQGEPNFEGGETIALKHLNQYFDSEAPSTYKITRNALDTWTHSTKFSPWLANGSLSVKMLLNRLRHYEQEVVANDSTYWIWFELLWREYFYWYAVEHQEHLFLFKGITERTTQTSFDQQRLSQWQRGDTPYPIINACMKQLNSTGYMSNRGRQLVASAFIHELGLDWRYGATYFEQQLIDYDVASNWGNWQYLAGVGADPRGCRQFNLTKQTQQHDPEGVFRDKWLS